ncbi:hypothetical protein D6C79_07980 [Aureobasidium pullulans]|nr:hypothetical protein D6C79_07980 [Aureobasidium pullulans]
MNTTQRLRNEGRTHPTRDYAKISSPRLILIEVIEVQNTLTMSFFELFPSFEPDPKASIKKEFDRLAQQQNWPKEVAERFRAVCYEDELADFSVAQGLTTPLKKLQMLCAELCVEDIPPSINKCKEALNKVKVNLVDLMNARRQGKQVRIFESYKDLSKYTRKKKMYCPKQAAKSEGIRVLLKRMGSN